MLNLKMSITKKPEVSFRTPKDYMLTKSQNDATINQILKTQTQFQMIGLFPSLFMFKACVSHYFTFQENKACKKCF